MWIYRGFQEPPNGTIHRSLLQLLGPEYGTLKFMTDFGVRTDFKSSMEVLETLCNYRHSFQNLHARVKITPKLDTYF